MEKSAPTTDETTPLPRHEASATVVEAGVGEQSPPGPLAAPGPAEGSATAVERPKPLHDPDPYSTPPYGEPGPWAPAPPVQHPATTPAHGTTVQQGTPGHGVHSPAAVAGTGAMAPAAPPEPGATTTMVAPQAAAPAPPPARAADGTHTPSPAPYGNAAPQPHSDTPHAVAPPYAGGSQPTSPPPAAPPYPDGSQPPSPVHPDASRAGTPVAPYTDSTQPPFADAPQGVSPAARDPWRNYDPWSAAGPLQQNGAGVDDMTRRRKRGMKILVLGAVLIALVSGGVGGAVGAYLERNGGVGEVELPQAGGGTTGRAPDSVAGIAASALPSVVTLHVSGSDAQGTGTGFVLDKRGHILTNNHVVEPAGDDGEITVTFSGGETADASLVGRDSGYDLAVVKVSGVDGLKPLPLGNSDDVRVGDPVVAIGAPFDLANTVTSGIISAKERPITAGGDGGDRSDVSYVDALQTDAPINPGNSGGPLVDVNARVIGINSAIRSAGSGSESDGGQAGSIGLGFAIPINQGKRVAEELINTGKATHPVIGVTLDMDYSGDGARVGDDSDGTVKKGGPADRAGIRAGDVITEVDGQRVHSGDELIVKVRAHRPGDRLELTLQRDGGEQKVTLTLGSSDGG
ncbi:trypsin-like peptidase domain-containing protein [Streptomyces sp. NPDC008159]|uniref:trypsin-like peptidase domain-containing protein n=1 Tax=Streptomyces sp. NPDC008159 TaxID=3364817 RepID=UPI0036EA84F3